MKEKLDSPKKIKFSKIKSPKKSPKNEFTIETFKPTTSREDKVKAILKNKRGEVRERLIKEVLKEKQLQKGVMINSQSSEEMFIRFKNEMTIRNKDVCLYSSYMHVNQNNSYNPSKKIEKTNNLLINFSPLYKKSNVKIGKTLAFKPKKLINHYLNTDSNEKYKNSILNQSQSQNTNQEVNSNTDSQYNTILKEYITVHKLRKNVIFHINQLKTSVSDRKLNKKKNPNKRITCVNLIEPQNVVDEESIHENKIINDMVNRQIVLLLGKEKVLENEKPVENSQKKEKFRKINKSNTIVFEKEKVKKRNSSIKENIFLQLINNDREVKNSHFLHLLSFSKEDKRIMNIQKRISYLHLVSKQRKNENLNKNLGKSKSNSKPKTIFELIQTKSDLKNHKKRSVSINFEGNEGASNLIDMSREEINDIIYSNSPRHKNDNKSKGNHQVKKSLFSLNDKESVNEKEEKDVIQLRQMEFGFLDECSYLHEFLDI